MIKHNVKRTIAFIVNPISGGIDKSNFKSLVETHLDQDIFSVEVHYTQSSQHNNELAETIAKRSDIDMMIAAGGDGTINHTAKYAAMHHKIFGIVPYGSGNGLARHLGLKPNSVDALKVINTCKIIEMDYGTINDNFFINVTGVGFDAHVTELFNKADQRGFWQYTKISLTEFAKYKPQQYEISIDGKRITEQAFIVCVANGSQYGNNAYIAPTANIQDGIFEITLIKPFKIWQTPLLGMNLFNKSLHQSALSKVYCGKEIYIKQPASGIVNIDGEPVELSKDLHVKMHHKGLKIIIP